MEVAIGCCYRRGGGNGISGRLLVRCRSFLCHGRSSHATRTAHVLDTDGTFALRMVLVLATEPVGSCFLPLVCGSVSVLRSNKHYDVSLAHVSRRIRHYSVRFDSAKDVGADGVLGDADFPLRFSRERCAKRSIECEQQHDRRNGKRQKRAHTLNENESTLQPHVLQMGC